MEVVIFGAGAVGLGLGSALLQAGAGVRFVAREATVTALGQRGLLRTGLFGRHQSGPLPAATTLAGLSQEPADYVLITTKAFDSEAAARALAAAPAIVGAEAPLVLCQNGWGSAPHFTPHFGTERIWNARIITGFRRLAPAHVEVTVHAEPVHMGSLFGLDPQRIAPLCTALARGGLPCEPSREIAADLWAKLLYNACLNPLGAICGVPYGALGASPDSRAVLEELARETFAVMQAAGFHTHWPDAAHWLRDFYARLLPPTAEHEPSTLQDLRSGHRTEVDALTGAIVTLADEHAIPVPTSRTLLHLLHFLERRARGQGRGHPSC